MLHNRRARRGAASTLSLVGACALILALLGTRVGPVVAQDDDDEPISVELVGSGVPSTVDGQVLELRKVTFQPGAILPAHNHPGALVLTVVEGELAYTLFEGDASIQRASEDGEAGPLEPLVIDEEAILTVGDSLFEEDVVHQARNPSDDDETVIWVSSLLAEGADFVHLTDEDAAEDDDETDDDEVATTDGDANVVEVILNEFDILMPTDLPAGETTFEIINEGSVAHGFTILGDDVDATTDDLILPGQTASLTVDLTPGDYQIICPVANHGDLGMTLDISVAGDNSGDQDDGDEEEEDSQVEDEDDAEDADSLDEEADDEDGDDATDEDADEDAETAEVTIDIADFAFDPAELEIEVGTTVTWTNSDSAPHTVTSDDDDFDSGRLDQGESFSFTFEDAGSFAYHCAIHPSMTALVEVVAAEEEETTIQIDIADFAFDPDDIEIEAGTTVTWTNSDSAPHTATSDDGDFDSGRLDQGDTFSFTFEDEGTFAYHCDFHPNMIAEIEVVAAEDDDGDEGNEGEEPQSGEVEIEIAGFAFSPESIEVEAGTTITWTNNDDAPHTVTADDGAFDSGRLGPGDTFTFTFEEDGSFAYHCDIHPRMTATVEVVE